MRSDETPFEQLPSVPPERLLPELLRFVRSSLATEFRWVTNLTDLAIALHLQPFMSLVRPTFLGEWRLARRQRRAPAGARPDGQR